MEVKFLKHISSLFSDQETNFDGFFQQDSSQSDGANIENPYGDLPLTKIQIFPSFNKRVITRKYQTLIEALSQLGGLASFLRIIGGFFLGFTKHIKILRTTKKELYDINLNYRKNENNFENLSAKNKDNEEFDESLEKKINESNFKRDLFQRNNFDRYLEENKIQFLSLIHISEPTRPY